MRSRIVTIILMLAFVVPAGVMGQHRHAQPQPPAAHRPHGPRPELRPADHPCAKPEQISLVMQTLRAQPSDDERLEIANLCVAIGHFCTNDMAAMASVFSFDDKKLEFLKYAYAYCTDPDRYPTLRDCFTFDSKYNDLMKFIYK